MAWTEFFLNRKKTKFPLSKKQYRKFVALRGPKPVLSVS